LQPQPALAELRLKTLQEVLEPYGIKVLELSATAVDARLLLSLRPEESVASCASKVKGQVSKWLKKESGYSAPTKLFSRGYFAITAGESTASTVRKYLQRQCSHHGYIDRPRQPVFVRRYGVSFADEACLQAAHACTILQFHVVLATWFRKGVFVPAAAEAVTDTWRQQQSEHNVLIEKVSFVPDHVHIAVRLHPQASPATVVVWLMNAAQEVIYSRFADLAVRASVRRLWQPSAYLGSFGRLQSAKVAAYVRKWEDHLTGCL